MPTTVGIRVVDANACWQTLVGRSSTARELAGQRTNVRTITMRRMNGDNERTWGWVGFAAQVAFVVSWLIAPAWQGADYNALKHSISDMYADTAPSGWFLVLVLTLCGLATVLFALLAVRPALRAGGRRATVGAALLALSIFGLGDLLSPFEREACRLADVGCTGSDQTANLGGKLDNVLSTAGILLFIAA